MTPLELLKKAERLLNFATAKVSPDAEDVTEDEMEIDMKVAVAWSALQLLIKEVERGTIDFDENPAPDTGRDYLEAGRTLRFSPTSEE